MPEVIITAKHVAAREGHKTIRERIYALSIRNGKPWNGTLSNEPVTACIDFGRWIAKCECGGAEYVDPDEPLFYCCSCGNVANNGGARPVTFPPDKERAKIEGLLLSRPVDNFMLTDGIEAALRARPLAPGFSRSWQPGESSKDIAAQNEQGMAAIMAKAKGK